MSKQNPSESEFLLFKSTVLHIVQTKDSIRDLLTNKSGEFAYGTKNLNILFGFGILDKGVNHNNDNVGLLLCEAIIETFPDFNINNRQYMGLSYFDAICSLDETNIRALKFLIKHQADVNSSDYVHFLCKNYIDKTSGSIGVDFSRKFSKTMEAIDLFIRAGHTKFNLDRLPDPFKGAVKKVMLNIEANQVIVGNDHLASKRVSRII